MSGLKRKLRMMFLLIGIVAATGTHAQSELETERFLMTFIPNIQFAPLYVAIAQDYFADAGLELQVEYLNEPDVMDLVAANQANFGVVSGEQVLLSISQGRPVVFVYDWFQTYPIGVVVSADSDIVQAEDLAGRRVGLPGRFGASYSGLITLLSQAGLSEDEIQIQEIGFNAPEVFCLGVVEASVIYINNEPLQIRNRAAAGECGDVSDVRVIPVADEANLVSNGIISSQSFLQENPERVASVVAIWDQALKDVIRNPARAYLLSAPYIDGLPLDTELESAMIAMAEAQDEFLASEPDALAIAESRLDQLNALSEQFTADELLQFEILLSTITLWDVADIGLNDVQDWEAMQDTLLDMGLLEMPLDLSEVYTNDFVPGYQD